MTIDIVGYYAPSGVGGSALNTAAPVRASSTRPNSPSPAPPVSNGDQPLANGQTFVQPFRSQTFNDPLGGGNSITIPVDATAVVLNVTITGPVSGGFVSVFPEGSPPVVSDVNFAANQTVSNLVIAKIGADGSVRFFHHGNGSHLVVDIAGWFGATGSRYVALPAPTREFDTRTGNERLGQMSLNQTLNLRERLVNGVPHDATAILAVFASSLPDSTGGYLNVFPSGAPTPFAAAFSFSPGQLVDNTVISGVGGNGNVSIFTHSNGTDVVSDLLGYFVP